MNQDSLPPFSDITQVLEDADLFTNASETHGILAGFVCGGINLDTQEWLTHFNDVVNEGQGIASEPKKLVTAIYQNVVFHCLDDNLSFNLLLPEEEMPLDIRAEAVAQWSQGFLVGFGMAQPALNKANDDIQELLRDIRDISQLSLDFELQSEESICALTEIEEYLRMGALLCFNSFSKQPKNKHQKTLH
ncbi:MAG TPA: YecA family protein [Psychromonas hadalis]|nr:YecA family protein [Psychromonas hadalis]